MDTTTTEAPAGYIVVPAGLLDRLMAERGVNGEQLARKAGVTPNTVSAARRGRAITPATLRKLDAALVLLPTLTGPIGAGLRGEVVPEP